MFYRSVVLKKGDIVYRDLNSQNQAKLIVHLYGNRAHAVFDPGSLDACVEIIAHLTFIVPMKLSAKEGCDVFRLYGMNGGTSQMFIDGLKILLGPEHDIGCIFGLHDAPVISHAELFDDRTKTFCKKIEPCVEQFNFEGIRKTLSVTKIRNTRKAIVDKIKWNGALVQLHGQPGMSIKIDLEAKRTPSRHADIEKPELLINKIEVIVQAFAIVGLKKRLVRLFVMPWLIGLAGFHR
jgi:hypothetical protein